MYQSIGRNWVARPALAMILGMVAQLGAETAEAHELYNEGDTSLDFNFTAMYAWLTSQENIQLLQFILQITHFIEVPDSYLAKGLSPCAPNYTAAQELMSKYFL